MLISRAWATPITIGAFSLMSVTGLLMFFHADRGFNKVAHEWVGLVLVGAVVFHAIANWPALKLYFLKGGYSRGMIALGLIALAVSFFSWTGEKRLPPPVMAMRAITNAPLAKVAAFAGRSTEQAIADLAKAGIRVADGGVTLEAATDHNRELQGKAIAVLFGKAH